MNSVPQKYVFIFLVHVLIGTCWMSDPFHPDSLLNNKHMRKLEKLIPLRRDLNLIPN